MSILLLSVTDNLDPDLRESLRLEIAMRGNTVAYISSEPQEGDRPYYLSTIEDYSKISEGVKVDYFDLSENFSDENLLKLLNYGTIYLSGGNTYVFMDSANKRNISQILNKHLESVLKMKIFRTLKILQVLVSWILNSIHIIVMIEIIYLNI